MRIALVLALSWLGAAAQPLPHSRRLQALSAAAVTWENAPVSGSVTAPPMMYHSACVLKLNSTTSSELALFGGRASGSGMISLTSDLWFYSISDSTWRKIDATAASPDVREQHSASCQSGKMVVHGGKSGSRVLHDTWQFNMEDLSWSLLPSASFSEAAVWGHASAWLGGSVYIFGGMSSSGMLTSSLMHLNLNTGAWDQVSSAGPSARYMHSSVVLKDCMLVYGGQNTPAGYSNPLALDDVWSFCPNATQWSVVRQGTAYYDSSLNHTAISSVNDTGIPLSEHKAVTVQVGNASLVNSTDANTTSTFSLMVVVGGILPQHDPVWYARPEMKGYDYYGAVPRQTLGSWQQKTTSGTSACAAIGTCGTAATLSDCQQTCDLTVSCNAVLLSGTQCCLQSCTTPLTSATPTGAAGYARIDTMANGTFLYPTFEADAGVTVDMTGHAAAADGDWVFVYGGQSANGSILGSLSRFQYAGSGCPAGTKGHPRSAACGECDIGSYAFIPGGYSCAQCDPGKYANARQSASCTSCPAGTYTSEHGSSSIAGCMACPAGKMSTSIGGTSATVCTDCPAGTYSSANATSCIPCSPGSASDIVGNAGNSSAIACGLCPSGTWSRAAATNCTKCAAGTYNGLPGRSMCLPCPAGYFGTDNRTTCTACDPGYFSSKSQALNVSVCQSCGQGTYSYAASSVCTDCVAGKYVATTGNTNSSDCLDCPVGRASAVVGGVSSDSCVSCSPGSYADGFGYLACTKCPKGTYLEQSGAMYPSDCQSCPAGKDTMEDGSARASQCISCPTGFGQDSNGVCQPCAAGKYAGVSPATNNASCIACNPGTYSSNTKQTVCDVCESGKFSMTGWLACSSCNTSFVCSPSCSSHGTCSLGTCICSAGYGDPSCSTELCPVSGCVLAETVTFEHPRFRINEDQTFTAQPSLYRTGCCSAATVVNITFNSSSASFPGDYSAAWVEARFEVGDQRSVIPVPIVQDVQVESCETLGLTATLPDNSVISATIEIDDDDLDSFVQSTVLKPNTAVSPSSNSLYLAPRAQEQLTFQVNVTRPAAGSCVGCPTGDGDCAAAVGLQSYCQTSGSCSGSTISCSCLGCSDREVDIVLIQDLTGSFLDDIANVQRLVANLMSDMIAIYPNAQFGVASFQDKPVAPFGVSGEYEFRVHQPLSADTVKIDQAVRSLTVKSSSIGDLPESQLTALLQASKQHATLGWRESSYRVAVLFTDAGYHVQGHGVFATGSPITTPNNLDTLTDVLEDYPSVLNVKNALVEQDIRPLFAVTSNVMSTYQLLVQQLGDGAVVELSADSSNLVTVVRAGMKQLDETVNLIAEPQSFWEFWDKYALSGSVSSHGVTCYDLTTAQALCSAASTACSGITQWTSCSSLSPFRLHSGRTPVANPSASSWLHVGSTATDIPYLSTQHQTQTGVQPGETAQFNLTLDAGQTTSGDFSFLLTSPGLGKSLVWVNRNLPIGCTDSCPASSSVVTSTVTCELTMADQVTSVYYNGQDITPNLSPLSGLSDVNVQQMFSFSTVEGAALAISGEIHSTPGDSCTVGGLVLACASSDSSWNQVVTAASTNWKVLGSDNKDAAPGDWTQSSFNTSAWAVPCESSSAAVSREFTSGSGEVPTKIWGSGRYSWFRFVPTAPVDTGTQCSGHGSCMVSTCQCDSGWESAPDCSLSTGQLASGLVVNGDMEAGTGVANSSTGWAAAGLGYVHDNSSGFGAQIGARMQLIPGGGASQIIVAGEGLPLNPIPITVLSWSTAISVLAARPHSLGIKFEFTNGSHFHDSVPFDPGTYGWRAFSKQYDVFEVPLDRITLEFSLPTAPAGSTQGQAYVDSVALLPDPGLACKCGLGFYLDTSYPGGCKRCQPGFFCGGGGKFKCGLNEYSHGGASECLKCPPGWVCTDGIGKPCQAPNFLFTNPASGTTACVPCPFGHECSGGFATTCPPGTSSAPGNAGCLLCTPGTISTTCASRACTACDAGKTSNYARDGCIGCAPGEDSLTGSHPCSSCAPGRFSPGGPAPRFPIRDYQQLNADQWCFPSTDSRTSLFLYGYTSVSRCFQLCQNTTGCTHFGHWYGTHAGTCTLWSECASNIEYQEHRTSSADFFSGSTAAATNSSTKQSLSGSFNRLYRVLSASCQEDVVHKLCNHRQVGLTMNGVGYLRLNAAVASSFVSTLEFWLYIPTAPTLSNVLVSKLAGVADRYSGSNVNGWLVELVAGSSPQLRYTSLDRSLSVNGVYSKTSGLAVGEWLHVAIVRNIRQGVTDYNDIQILIDGVDKVAYVGECCPYSSDSSFSPGTDQPAGVSTPGVDHSFNSGVPINSQPLQFGPAEDGLRISGVRYWGDALNSSTVVAWMDTCAESSHPNWAALQTDLELDQGSGDVIADGLGNGDATITGGLTWWTQPLPATAATSIVSSSQQGGDLCTACPHGKYGESDGMRECSACPTGQNTSSVGAANVSDCA